MRCMWMLALCALPLCFAIPRGGWAQQQTPPTAEVNQVEGDSPQIRINHLTKQLAELRKQHTTLVSKLVAEYCTRPESLEVIQERDQARAALKATTDQVLTQVREDPRYRAELARKQEAQARLQRARAAAKPDPIQANDAATAYHRAVLKLAQMEGDALDLDPQIAAAKARLADAELAETHLQRVAQAYASTHPDAEQIAIGIWKVEMALDDATADRRVAAALQNPTERVVARGEVDDTELLLLNPGPHRGPFVRSKITRREKVSDPLPIGSGSPVVPPLGSGPER